MYLLIAISFLALALLWMAVRGRSAEVKDLSSAGALLTQVDIEAFRNLIDPAQDQYLQMRLSAADYRRVQRARALAVAEYLHMVAANASIMLRAGESASESEDAAVAAMGAEMASSAVNLRLKCLLALSKAYAGVIFPGSTVPVIGIVDRYDVLAMRLHAARHSWSAAPAVIMSR